MLVRAERLTGSGVVQANGGDACLTGGPPSLLPAGEGRCGVIAGTGGGGGGGRVAVYATSCEWTGALAAQGGIDQAAYELAHRHAEDHEYNWESELEESAFATGQNGSVYFHQESGSCTNPNEEGSLTVVKEERPKLEVFKPKPALKVGKPSLKAGKVLVPLACAEAPCKVQLELSTKLTAKTQGKGKGKGKKGKRSKAKSLTALLAKQTLELKAGAQKTVSISLDSTGERLLQFAHKLKVQLTVSLLPTSSTGAKSVVKTTSLTLTAPKHGTRHKRHKKHRG
ncbi:MAG TPA: hypothetical protein VGF95_06075 [Solirubrobacteraceae bacterium]